MRRYEISPAPKALVIRDGVRRRIASRELVRGDIIVVSEGDRVPADALVVSGAGIAADESLLTGEAVPVRKLVWSGGEIEARPGGDDHPAIYSGTLIVKGHGIGEVRFTGAGTEIGKIGTALSEISVEPTLLHVQVRKLVRAIAVVALILSVTAFGLYVAIRGEWLQGLLAGITLAMSLLPQELPLVLTVFLVMGARRIAQKGSSYQTINGDRGAWGRHGSVHGQDWHTHDEPYDCSRVACRRQYP